MGLTMGQLFESCFDVERPAAATAAAISHREIEIDVQHTKTYVRGELIADG